MSRLRSTGRTLIHTSFVGDKEFLETRSDGKTRVARENANGDRLFVSTWSEPSGQDHSEPDVTAHLSMNQHGEVFDTTGRQIDLGDSDPSAWVPGAVHHSARYDPTLLRQAQARVEQHRDEIVVETVDHSDLDARVQAAVARKNQAIADREDARNVAQAILDGADTEPPPVTISAKPRLSRADLTAAQPFIEALPAGAYLKCSMCGGFKPMSGTFRYTTNRSNICQECAHGR